MALGNVVAQTTRETPPVPMRGPNNQAWAPPGASCLRCGGLLVLCYLASLESDLSGRPMRQWRCVNCGDCIDHDILGNRWNGPVSAYETADSRTNLVFPQSVKHGVLEVRMPKTEAAKKHALTVEIDHALVSRVSSQERSSRHG